MVRLRPLGPLLLILGVSLASTNYMIDAGVPQMLFATISELVSGPTNFLWLLLAFLLVLGAILDIFSAIVLVVPLLLPVAAAYGIDPVTGKPRLDVERVRADAEDAEAFDGQPRDRHGIVPVPGDAATGALQRKSALAVLEG